MKRIVILIMASVPLVFADVASAQQDQSAQPAQPGTSSQSGSSGTSGATTAQPSGPVAGRVPLGVTVTQMEAIVVGQSAKKDLLGKTVVNDQKEKIGKIDDIILSPGTDTKVPIASFAIIGVGGFLGLGRYDVAIPMEQLKIEADNIVLPGATKDALKALPQFEYARKK